jgi:hypothetical protein
VHRTLVVVLTLTTAPLLAAAQAFRGIQGTTYIHILRRVKAGCGRSPQVEAKVEVEAGEKTEDGGPSTAVRKVVIQR